MAKKLKLTQWSILDSLEDEESIAAYLQIVANENDPDELIAALGTVAHARGINNLAKEMGIDREILYKDFKGKTKPKSNAICDVINKIGLEFSFQPKQVKA